MHAYARRIPQPPFPAWRAWCRSTFASVARRWVTCSALPAAYGRLLPVLTEPLPCALLSLAALLLQGIRGAGGSVRAPAVAAAVIMERP